MPGSQFSGIPLDLRGLKGNPLHILPVPQVRIEEVLEQRALELGAELRRAHEVVAFEQDGDGVTVDVHGPEGAYQVRTRYLVGADGGHSSVRRQAGIAFPGTTDEGFSALLGNAIIPESLLDPQTGLLVLPGVKVDVPLRPLTHIRLPGGIFTFAMLPPGSGVHLVAVMEWDQPPADDSVPMTFEDLRAGLRRLLGTDLPMSPAPTSGPHLLNRLSGVSSRQAETYRVGRVLLVGDAAHVHSAVGGPGLNLGMQDALNLGWKLAAELRGRAPDGLLDTYESERAPFSRRVIMQTRAQMALMRPGSDISSARDLLAELLEDENNRRRIAELMAGTDVRYDLGGDGSDPLVSQWLPDLQPHIADGWTQIAERQRAGRAVLVDFTEGAAVAAAAEGWRDRIDVVRAEAADQSLPLAAALVRPDGYVAWAATDGPSQQPVDDGLREALARWFGAAG